MSEEWRSAILEWVELKKQRPKKLETFSEQQRSEILSCLPGGSDTDFAIHASELNAHNYEMWMDNERASKKRKKILSLCLKLNTQLSPSDVIFFFSGDREVWKLKRMLESIKSRKSELNSPNFNAKQEARNFYMDQVLDTWFSLGGKMGGSTSSMVAFFRAAWPKALMRYRPTNAAIVAWAYARERDPLRGRKWEDRD